MRHNKLFVPGPLSSRRLRARTRTSLTICLFFFIHDDSSPLFHCGAMRLPSAFCFQDLFWSAYMQKHLLLYAYTSFVRDLVLVKLGAVGKCLGKLLLFARLLTGCILCGHVAIIMKQSPPIRGHSIDPRPSPNFSLRLQDKIWEWPGDEAKRMILFSI